MKKVLTPDIMPVVVVCHGSAFCRFGELKTVGPFIRKTALKTIETSEKRKVDVIRMTSNSQYKNIMIF
jgi:hypothetical protein